MFASNFSSFLYKKWSEISIFGLFVVGFLLTIVSHFRLCSAACTAAHHYRLYTFSFEVVGLVFFSTACLIHLLSLRWSQFRLVLNQFVALAVGAEIYFLLFQKFVIGSWCPVCLTLAAVLLLTFCIMLFNQKNRSSICRNYTLKCGVSIFLGFIISSIALTKEVPSYVVGLSDQLIIGNKESVVEVYIFSDWMCSSCHVAEPEVIEGVSKIFLSTKVYFVDLAINKESMNYLPYNLNFMVNNKDNYLNLRKALGGLAKDGIRPSSEIIREVSKVQNVSYNEPLGYLQVNEGRKYFKGIAKQFRVVQTPTVIIRNRETNEEKRLVGAEEISQIKITNLVSALSQ